MVCNPKPMPTDKAETKIAKCVIGRPIIDRPIRIPIANMPQ